MIKEIYIRSNEDPNYRGQNVVDYFDEVEEIISQIRVLLGTSKGEVLGSYIFGLDLEDLIFGTSFNSIDLENKINDEISTYISPFFDNHSIHCKVQLGHGPDGLDYGLIDIYIDEIKSVGIEVV